MFSLSLGNAVSVVITDCILATSSMGSNVYLLISLLSFGSFQRPYRDGISMLIDSLDMLMCTPGGRGGQPQQTGSWSFKSFFLPAFSKMSFNYV